MNEIECPNLSPDLGTSQSSFLEMSFLPLFPSLLMGLQIAQIVFFSGFS